MIHPSVCVSICTEKSWVKSKSKPKIFLEYDIMIAWSKMECRSVQSKTLPMTDSINNFISNLTFPEKTQTHSGHINIQSCIHVKLKVKVIYARPETNCQTPCFLKIFHRDGAVKKKTRSLCQYMTSDLHKNFISILASLNLTLLKL